MRFDDISEGVAGPKNCWPGYRKVGTKPGTGKNAGKRVNDCEKIKEGISDEVDGANVGEYDREGDMAQSQLKTAEDAAAELRSILDADENLPEWVQSKITKAVDYLDTARDYMKSKEQGVAEAGWGRRSSYYNPMDQERREQDAMDQSKRDFKRAELQHELGHEDDPNFERNLRQQQIDRDRGPWYIRIDGKIYRQKGQPKSFDWKRGANNYALAMIKNNPSLQGKIMLTKSAEDK